MNRMCPVCGHNVADNSNYCPNCGHDMSMPPKYGQNMATDPVQVDNNNPFDAAGPEGKSRGIAALLAFFLGGLGVHYFYCGKTGGGLICLLLTILTCGLWTIITTIQFVYLLCISNAEFERKWILSTNTFPVF